MALTVEVVAIFLFIALSTVLVARKIKVPFTILLVLVGLGLSALAVMQFQALTGLTGFFHNLAAEQLFVGFVLPPLLFESVIGVKLEDFRAVYRPALLLATVGVMISTVVVGVVLWKVVGLSVLVSFLFAALISPTDIATVLEVFSRVNVPRRLATLLEMEAVFNDPTAIAIFTIVLATSTAAALRPFQAVAEFTYFLSGGTLVGLGVAWGARRLQPMIEDSVTQVILTLSAVYGSYTLATTLGTSGLIAVAVTGIYYGNTALFKVEKKGVAEATREFWRVFAFVANAAAFLFIGLSTNIFLLATSFGAFMVAYGVVIMARITSVYPILSLTKVAGSVIPSSWMNASTLGGMRGALAIALVSVLPADSFQAVATLTFGVVMLSILLQGPLLSIYTRRSFGRQETLPEPPVQEQPKEEGSTPKPEETLSPDPPAGEANELRGSGEAGPAERVLLQNGRELP